MFLLSRFSLSPQHLFMPHTRLCGSPLKTSVWTKMFSLSLTETGWYFQDSFTEHEGKQRRTNYRKHTRYKNSQVSNCRFLFLKIPLEVGKLYWASASFTLTQPHPSILLYPVWTASLSPPTPHLFLSPVISSCFLDVLNPFFKEKKKKPHQLTYFENHHSPNKNIPDFQRPAKIPAYKRFSSFGIEDPLDFKLLALFNTDIKPAQTKMANAPWDNEYFLQWEVGFCGQIDLKNIWLN